MVQPSFYEAKRIVWFFHERTLTTDMEESLLPFWALNLAIVKIASYHYSCPAKITHPA